MKFTFKFKKLFQYYKKQLTQLHKVNIKNSNYFIEYVYTYICFLRDFLLLTADNIDPNTNLILLSLLLASEEYVQYKTCINSYYNITTNCVSTKKTSENSAEVLIEYQKERQLHWTRFWSIVQQNLESWLEVYDFTV